MTVHVQVKKYKVESAWVETDLSVNFMQFCGVKKLSTTVDIILWNP